MPSVLAPPDRRVPPDVTAHCEAHGLSEHLWLALRLAEQTFGPIRHLTAEVETDPETGEPAVVIDVASELGPDEAVVRKRAYTQQWVASVPPDVIGRIRLVLDVG